MTLGNICQQLRLLAARLHKQWETFVKVINYSESNYDTRYKQQYKVNQLIFEYQTEAGWLILKAFEEGAFRHDYSLCSIIGNLRSSHKEALRQPLGKSYIRSRNKYAGYSVYVAVSRHWIAHPRRGIDKYWRHRYLTPPEQYAFVCTTLADYLENEQL